MAFSTTIYIIAAIYFAVLIAVELTAMNRKGERLVLSDSLNSLMMGAGSLTLKILLAGFELWVFKWVYDYGHVLSLDAANPGVWAAAYILTDFCFYWSHRLHHEINALWASHVQHHSSEEYNLTTALRQEWTSIPYEVIFYLPLAIIGVPYEVFAGAIGLNLLYQFWLHSRHIPKLPRWFEAVFNTASHHRVHHAQNARYMDRNYGGTLIVWDRLFRTFQEELAEEPVVFGVTTPPQSWSPLETATHVWRMLWQDARAATHWSDKLTLWFRPTGWRPRNMPPYEKADGYPEKHAHAAPLALRALASAGFLGLVALLTIYLAQAQGSFADKLPLAAAIFFLAALTGKLLDFKPASTREQVAASSISQEDQHRLA